MANMLVTLEDTDGERQAILIAMTAAQRDELHDRLEDTTTIFEFDIVPAKPIPFSEALELLTQDYALAPIPNEDEDEDEDDTDEEDEEDD